MYDFGEGIGRIGERLATLAGADVSALSDDELCAATIAVEQAGRILDGLRVKTAEAIDDRSGRGLGGDGLALRRGCRNGAHLVERLTGVAQAEAARRVRLGKAIRHRATLDGHDLPPQHPFVAQAMAEGRIGLDAAAVIVRCMDDALRTAGDDDVLAAEEALVQAAAASPADEIGVQARAWREALDPDGAEPRDERLYRKRAFVLGREGDGLTPFSGALEPVGAALLKAAFAEAEKPGATPRFVTEVDRVTGTSTTMGRNPSRSSTRAAGSNDATTCSPGS